MKNAIILAKEMKRKEKAIAETKSEKLRRDYTISLSRDRKELRYYCKCIGISMRDVFAKI